MSAMTQSQVCASDLALDRRLSGEMSAQDADVLDAHLADCVRCRLRHELMERQRSDFLAQTPSWRTFDQQVRAQQQQVRRSWPRWAGGLAAVAAVAMLFAWQRNDSDLPYSRTKGTPSLGYYIKRGNQVQRGISGDTVHPGDVLRFTYTAERPVYFALVNADDTSATIYHPLTPTSMLIEPGRDAALDFGVELDARIGTERVFGLFCDRPLTLEPVRVKLESEGHLPELPHCHVDTLVLEKRSR